MLLSLPPLALLWAFFAGLLIGSFLNVCIYRIPRDISVVAPRSFCTECGKPLRWFQNVPLISYAFLRGRCGYCRTRIPLRYPVVELTTAGLFLFITLRFGWSQEALKWAVFVSVLTVLFWTDLEERILPDEVILFGSAAALVSAYFVPLFDLFGSLLFPSPLIVLQSMLNAFAGAALLSLPIWLIGGLYSRFRRRQALGLGDVKLLAMLGLFLGPERGLLAVTIGTVGGAIAGIFYLLITKKDRRSYELPFGSFLCLGAAVTPFFFA